MDKELDRAVERIDGQSLVGYVADFRIKNPQRSYLYVDNGTLKFYNHSTKTTSSVDLT